MTVRLLIAVILAMACASPLANATESGNPAVPATPAFRSLPPATQLLINVFPHVAPAGVARTLYIRGGDCVDSATVDESAVPAGTLVIKAVVPIFSCGQPPVTQSYTPRANGKLRVILQRPDGSAAAETTLETAATGRPALNIDGMWSDPATNGSGISFHQSTATEAAFGTWFMFSAPPPPFQSIARWYSLQGFYCATSGATLGGSVLEVVRDTEVRCQAAGCPAKGKVSFPVGTFKVTFADQSHARIEAFDREGVALFASNLQRLQF